MVKQRLFSAAILTLFVGFIFKSNSYATTASVATLYTDGELAFVKQGDVNSHFRVIFIHGSPGSKEAYKIYLNDKWLQKHAELISVDRIGYGQSPHRLDASLDSQADSILPLLAKDKANILVGHSLGGPIALDVALMHPDLVQGLVLVAPAFDPKLEKPKWYNWIADTWLVNVFLSENWSRSNAEMMPLSSELNKLSHKNWLSLNNVPVTLIHGVDDSISDPNNSVFALARLSGKSKKLVKVEGQGHFILWDDPQTIITEIKAMLSSIPPVKSTNSPSSK
ncbi:alpha/beta hydrolase [Vibrio sp. S4M6]|uniref:alpha/beta fold hydrolase n=1 Tax=Vibrio sinus TaxID=2946865 RepID=UPI00202A31C6|nr:alpha/beta hydrolase [Vibrio sinus]MCL9782461.1 alpha/beta hydrolase [Vibrio sinus]